MRGQWIVLTALAVVVAVAVIYMAYVSSLIVPVASIQRPAYGIMSQDWPELVQDLAGYIFYLAETGASSIATAALNAGLYNNLTAGYPLDRYLQLQEAGQLLGASLSALEQNLLPTGTFIQTSYRVNQSGFGGTLGPYPAAVVLSNKYNFTYLLMSGVLVLTSDYAYRFLVAPSQPIQSPYVVIYSADVRQPSAVG
ncbi:MAG: hypothetical protein QXK63_06920, partial [Thermoproteus sp.]